MSGEKPGIHIEQLANTLHCKNKKGGWVLFDHMWYHGFHLEPYISAPENTMQTQQAKKRFLIYLF